MACREVVWNNKTYTSVGELSKKTGISASNIRYYLKRDGNLNNLKQLEYDENGKLIHTARFGTCKNKIGDIINNKKILEITPYTKPNRGQTLFKVKVECLKCHRIFTYNEMGALSGANPNYCLKCKSTWVLNGKTYHNRDSITKDFGVDAGSVIHQYKKHNGDVSQVGKGHYSKYCAQPIYKPGEIINGREIIKKLPHTSKNLSNDGYLVKCIYCGAVVKTNTHGIRTSHCSCIGHPRRGVTMIKRTEPNPNRTQNLPRNIYYRKDQDCYIVHVSAGGNNKYKTFTKRFKYLKDAIAYVPVLKGLALEYKQQLEQAYIESKQS